MAGVEFSEDDIVQLSLLRDEETDALIDAGFLGDDHRLSSPMDDLLCFTHDELVLQVTAGIHYPVTAPVFNLINLTLSRKEIDGLRNTLRCVIEDAADTNCAEKWLERENTRFGIFEAKKVVLQMAQEADTLVKALRSQAHLNNNKQGHRKGDETECMPWEQKKAAETITTNEIALEYLGKSAREICEMVPSHYRVLHAECVIRRDLATRFDACRAHLREELMKHPTRLSKCCLKHTRLEDKVEHLLRPRITFHGTQRHFVPSIVRHGFLKPGSRLPKAGKEQDHENVHQVRCGSTYGRGIYSSPSPDFSLSYSNDSAAPTSPTEYFGLKLIVCATIMGRARQMLRGDNWREQSVPYKDADSHVANRDLEYIVFNPAQIIPVYVLHLDWGTENAAHFENLPMDAREWKPPADNKIKINEGLDSEYAGERQRAKEAVFAKAAKYFPYGYGPATGGRFVVEEVGEVSEDEEDYGEYQAMRGTENKDKTDNAQTNFWGWIKAAEEERRRPDCGDWTADEYALERNTFEGRPENWDLIEKAEWEEIKERGEEENNSFDLDEIMFR